MTNVDYFDVKERGVAKAHKDSRFSGNTIPYRLNSRANTGRRYQGILNGLRNEASTVSEKTLLGESINLGNGSPVTQPVMSIVEETAPMKRLMANLYVKDRNIGSIRVERMRAIKLAQRRNMFSNTVRNAHSAYVVLDKDKLPENVETPVFASQGFVPEVPPIVPPAIDVQRIVENNESQLANDVNNAMEQGAVPVAPIQGEITNRDIENEIEKALAAVVQNNVDEVGKVQSVAPTSEPVVDNVISPSEVSSVVNGGSVQSDPTNVIIFDADGSECYYQQKPGEEAVRTVIYPDNGEATNVLIYEEDGGEYHYQQKPGDEAVRTVIYPDNGEATNVLIYEEDGGEYHYQQEPGGEAVRTVIYPDNGEKAIEEVPLTVTLDPKEVFIYGDDGETLHYQQSSDEHGLYQVQSMNENIRGGIVAPDRDDAVVSDKVLDNTNNSIIEQLKEKAERLRRANEDRTSSLNNLIDTRSQKQDYVSQIQQTLDATKNEVIARYQSLVERLKNEGEEIDNERRSVENVLASLDEEQVAKENALASYKRELEELDSMDVKRR